MTLPAGISVWSLPFVTTSAPPFASTTYEYQLTTEGKYLVFERDAEADIAPKTSASTADAYLWSFVEFEEGVS